MRESMRERSTHTPVSEDRDKRTKCFVSSENPKILLMSLNPSFGFQCTLVAMVGRANSDERGHTLPAGLDVPRGCGLVDLHTGCEPSIFTPERGVCSPLYV